MFSDNGHVEVGAVPAAQRSRQPVAQPPGLICPPPHLVEQVFPVPRRDATVCQVGAGELASAVEVLFVLRLQGSDFAFDEVVDLGQYLREMLWQGEIHVISFYRLRSSARSSAPGSS